MKRQFAINQNFQAYAAALRHHYLLEVGKEDDADTEKTEELLSELWGKLNDTQRLQGRGLSSDLNWLRRKYAPPPPKGRKREDVTPEELRDFYRLKETLDYLHLLPALRVCAAAVPPVTVAFVRADCYGHIGLRAVANLFLQATIELGRKESTLSRIAFDTLVFVSPFDAVEQANRIIAALEKYAPISVAQSITYVIGFLGGDPTMFARDDLAEILRQADKRLDEEPTPQEDRVSFLMTTGAQLVSFGKVDEGIDYLEQALKLEPEAPELLGWLGEASYQKDGIEQLRC